MKKYITQLSVLFTFFVFGVIFPKNLLAMNIPYNEDFESGDNNSNWHTIQGNPSYVNFSNGELNLYIPVKYTVNVLTNKLIKLPSDYLITYDMKPLQGQDKNILIKFIDTSNFIELHISGQNYYLASVDNGKVSNISQGQYFWNNGDVKSIKIQKINSDFNIFIDNNQIVNFTDPLKNKNEYQFGFRVGTGASFPTSVSFDNLVVSVPDGGKVLAVEPLKQFQEPWGPMEYANASQWTENGKITFSDWGCALVSAVMIMRYHGLKTMPDGQDLNPLSVNEWMLNNNGYLPDSGLVSFSALTVLAKEIANIFPGTPALEYQVLKTSLKADGSYTNLTEEGIKRLDLNEPVIVQKTGHFMVGNGYTENLLDLRIIDPAYTYTKFSQHNSNLLSVRTFIPSFTDLRFLEIVAPSSMKVQLNDNNNNPISDATYTNYVIENPTNGEFSKDLTLIEWAKPNSGEYRIYAEVPLENEFVNIRTINTSGMQTVANYEYKQDETIVINIDEDGKSDFSIEKPNPTPTPTVTPQPTASPEPSSTPQPTLNPEPSPTPEPTSTPEPSPNPSPSPSPSISPQPSPTPTATPEPSKVNKKFECKDNYLPNLIRELYKKKQISNEAKLLLLDKMQKLPTEKKSKLHALKNNHLMLVNLLRKREITITAFIQLHHASLTCLK